jgi:arylsulfatase A-like enzyme
VGRVPDAAALSRARAAACAGLALLGCARREPRLALDLARRAPVAELRTNWDTWLLGTPRAEPRQTAGLRSEAIALGDASASAEREAELLLRWPEPAARAAVLDLSAPAGQALRVRLNDIEVGRIALAEGRGRHRFELPPEAQRPRANRLQLRFERQDAQGRAASLHSLVVGDAGDPWLEALASDGAPPLLSVAGSGVVPEIVQAAPSALRFAFLAPEGAELRFEPKLRADPQDVPVAFEVQLEAGADAPSRLWSQTLSLRGAVPGEVRLPLGVAAGTPVRLSLQIDAERAAWGVWSGPRIMGLEAARPLLAPEPADDDQRAASLRRSLAGCNVLLVILDAASARHFSSYGYSRGTTPEIDRLAREGVVFERAYTPAVFTRAAMASLWTSRYPDAGMSRDDMRLPSEPLTLTELLGAQGVRTAGWVANPNAGTVAGLERGFDEFHGVYAQPGRPGGAVRADAVVERALPWLVSPREGRFFAYLHFREPHFPYDPPPPFDTRFGPDAPLPQHARDDKSWTIRVSLGRLAATPQELDHLSRLYDGNLAYADHQLGVLRRALEAAGLWERTLTIVSADHGEELYEHGFIGHNEQVYQETTWIPLVMRFPAGAGPAGTRVGALVDLLDLAPTIADAFGLLGRAGSATAFQGRSLLPVALGAPGKSATVSRSVMKRPSYALSDGRFKFIDDVRRGAQELYDLAHDPSEREDLAQRDPLRAAAFREALYRFRMDTAGGGAAPGRPPSPEELEQLRALGYVN